MPTVIITGASSGIGKALAREYAQRGYSLGLAARRIEILEDLKQELLQKHSEHPLHIETLAMDVCKIDDVFQGLEHFKKQLGQLDYVYVNAGVGERHQSGTPFEKKKRVIETNVLGAMATIDAAVEIFKAQNTGHLIVISSIAAFRGIAKNATYCASKAAISTYTESVMGELAGLPIHVTCLHPGYIDTPINQDTKSRPFVISAEKSAPQIIDLVNKRKLNSTIPVLPWGPIGWILRHIPSFVWRRLMQQIRPKIYAPKTKSPASQ